MQKSQGGTIAAAPLQITRYGPERTTRARDVAASALVRTRASWLVRPLASGLDPSGIRAAAPPCDRAGFAGVARRPRLRPLTSNTTALARRLDRLLDESPFDRALWGHMAFTISNAARSLWLGFTGGEGVSVPAAAPETRRYLQMMTRFSSAFALLSDTSMFVIGGSLKRREKISARLGDILSLLYIASATVKRFHDEGRQKDDLPLLTWAMYDSFFKLQVAMDGVIDNFPNRFVAFMLRQLVFPKGLTLNAPFDKVGSKVANILITPGAARDRLTAGAYIPRNEDDVIGRLEFAMEAVIKADPIDAKLRKAGKEGKLPQRTLTERRAAAVTQGIITQEEHDHLNYTDRLRHDVVKVDDFEHELGRGARPAESQEETWQQTESRKKAVVASM